MIITLALAYAGLLFDAKGLQLILGPRKPSPIVNVAVRTASPEIKKNGGQPTQVVVTATPGTDPKVLELEARVQALQRALETEFANKKELRESAAALARTYVQESEQSKQAIEGLSIQIAELKGRQAEQVTGTFTVLIDAPRVAAQFASNMVSANRCVVVVDAHADLHDILNHQASSALRSTGFKTYNVSFLRATTSGLAQADLKAVLDLTLAGIVILIEGIEVRYGETNYGIVSYRGRCTVRAVYSGTGEEIASTRISVKGLDGDNDKSRQRTIENMGEAIATWLRDEVRSSPQIPTRTVSIAFTNAGELDRTLKVLRTLPSVRNIQVQGEGNARTIVLSATDSGFSTAAALKATGSEISSGEVGEK